MDSRSMRKVLLAAVVLLCFILCSCSAGEGKALTPIEQITGINTPATLKSGCYITKAYLIPYDDNGICADDKIVPLWGSKGIINSNIRIIDVYGDNCTIVFRNAENRLYASYEYPLSNLLYDASKVEAARDDIQTELLGSGYTLSPAGSTSSPVIFAATVAGFVIITSAIYIRYRANNPKTKEEQQ
ncbi:MAG: hypothetical protein K5745_09225 [Saccharofermentans sp.]|nr:hypothetical protein [Saccharofermentans sp.]